MSKTEPASKAWYIIETFYTTHGWIQQGDEIFTSLRAARKAAKDFKAYGRPQRIIRQLLVQELVENVK